MGAALIVGGGLLLVYTFVGYPLLLAAGAALARRVPGRKCEEAGSELPEVSITVPVHNEAHQIRDVLRSLVELDYPADRRQILVVSDGSTDGTDEIVREWADRGVELLRVDERGGKGAAENAARHRLRGEIVVNTDASIRIRPDALRHLVRHFADPSVGVVSGRDVSIAAREADANRGEAGYVGYEMWIRDLETRLGGIVGASGCLYATRRELHRVHVPPELSRDFASALIARERGYAAVSEPEAVCYVPRTGSLEREYRRKVRTVARGMATLWAWKQLMNPLAQGSFAWKLLSHKVCRWLVPWALVATGLGLGLLAGTRPWAGAAFAGGALGVALGAGGWLLAREDRGLPSVLAAAAFFLMTNVAVMHAGFRAAGTGSERMWEPTRREESRAGG
jgi:hypothetical protein